MQYSHKSMEQSAAKKTNIRLLELAAIATIVTTLLTAAVVVLMLMS